MTSWSTPDDFAYQMQVDGYMLQMIRQPGRNPWRVMLFYHNGSAASVCQSREEAEERAVEMLDFQREKDAAAFADLI